MAASASSSMSGATQEAERGQHLRRPLDAQDVEPEAPYEDDEPDAHRRRLSYNEDCDADQYDDDDAEIEGGEFGGLPRLDQFITRISSTEIYDEPSTRAKFIGPYFVSDRLGSGSYATVKECVDSRTLQRFALKILSYRKGRKIPTFEQDIRSEIRLLSRLRHNNVIQLFDILEKRKSDNVKKYLVLTYCIADMQHILEFARGHKYPEYQAQRYFRQTCDGLEYLHAVGVIHKDIKPSNLLIAQDDSVRITDFGVAELLSTYAPDDRIQRSAGTIAFQPPEVFNSTEEECYPGFKLDVWSLGVTLYNITSGLLPFAIGSDPGAMFRLMSIIGKAEWQLPPNLSTSLGELITCMMDPSATTRYSLAQVKRSDWFVAQLPQVGEYVNPNIGRMRDALPHNVEMFVEPDGTRTVKRNALDTVCQMSVLDHLDEPAAPVTAVMPHTRTSEDIEKEMRASDLKTSQLYARMNIKDDDLDEDTAEAFMFTIRSPNNDNDNDEDEEENFRQPAQPQPQQQHQSQSQLPSSSGGMGCQGNGVSEERRRDDSGLEQAAQSNVESTDRPGQADEKANKKGRQKKSPKSPSFCKLS